MSRGLSTMPKKRKRKVILEIKLLGAEIKPETEVLFLSAFRALGLQLKEALLEKEGLNTEIKVYAE